MKFNYESFERITIEEFHEFPPKSIYKVYSRLVIYKDGYIEYIDNENKSSRYYELNEKYIKELYERLLEFFDNIHCYDCEMIGRISKKLAIEFRQYKIETEEEDDIDGVMYQEIIDDYIHKYAHPCGIDINVENI